MRATPAAFRMRPGADRPACAARARGRSRRSARSGKLSSSRSAFGGDFAGATRGAVGKGGQGDELRTDPFDGGAVVSAEIGDGFVIRNEPSRQPHHFQIAASLTLQPPARLDSVEIAVNVSLSIGE